MKSYIVLLIVLIFSLVGCKKPLKKAITEDEYGKVVYYMDQDSLIQGVFVRMDEKGDTTEISNYLDDKLHGTRLIFTDGKLEIKEHYVKDELNGPYTTFYQSGQVNVNTVYEMGVMNQKIYKYYENGVLAEEVQMRNNEENGPFKEFFPSGKLHWKGNYINGDNEDGLLLEYDEEGKLIQKLMCGLYHEERICQTIWDLERGDIPLKLEFDD